MKEVVINEEIFQEGFKEGYFLHTCINTKPTEADNLFIHSGYQVVRMTVNFN